MHTHTHTHSFAAPFRVDTVVFPISFLAFLLLFLFPTHM